MSVSLERLKEEIVANQFEILPLGFDHIIRLSTLENHHRDPFDRIIIAQAFSEGLTIISKDSNFRLYREINTLW